MKMKLLMSAIFLIFLAAGVFAQCNSTQVDINSASSSELQKIINIGPAYAEQIISLRPFNSVDDLTRVSGIAETRLAEIKQQGLACVAENSSVPSNSAAMQNSSVNTVNDNIQNVQETQTSNSASAGKNQNLPSSHEVINLNSASPNSSQSSAKKLNFGSIFNSNNLAIYGLAAFAVVLGALFAARKLRTKRYKSEFD